MKITILCSDKNHPIISNLKDWIKLKNDKYEIDLVYEKQSILSGSILFLISCNEIITKDIRKRFDKTFVIHASNLPHGRGWSPHVWEIINGSNHLFVSLLSAEDKVDSGDIYKKVKIKIEPHELWNEINEKLFKKEIELMDYAISSIDILKGIKQDSNISPTYYSKRTPNDSNIDPSKSIKSQFNKIRIMDPNRYPAFFELYGFKYKIHIKKLDE